MASFTPDELNIIYSRGFEGSPGPLRPTNADRMTYYGIPYLKLQDVPQNIMHIGDVNSFVAGSITFTKDLWISSVTATSEDAYNGAKSIRVSVDGDGTFGHVNIRYLDEDGNVLPGVNYDGYFAKTVSDLLYAGDVYLTLCYDTRDSEILFGMGCLGVYNKNTGILINTLPVQLVNGTQWTPNQPWVYWMQQNTSGWYDPEQEVPEMTEGGGGGGWFRDSDTVGFSGLPSLDVLSFGFVGMYQLSTAQMASLSTFLWSSNFIDNILKAWQDPFQNIINVAFVPLNAELTGAASDIKIGNLSSGVSATKLSKSLYEKDFGSINLKELYGNFADYAPFTKLQIYLPGAGVKQINPDDYMDGSIHLKAFIDIFSGTCVYQLLSQRHGRQHVVDHYEANIMTQIPITGRNFIDAYKSVINGIATVTSGAVTGSALAVPLTKATAAQNAMRSASAVNNAIDTAAGGTSSLLNLKPSYEKSGSISGSAMRLSVQTPYIFFDTPQLRQAKEFKHLHGYKSNIYAKLGDCTGFVSVQYMDISGINAPDNIKQKILDSLYKGVHIH